MTMTVISPVIDSTGASTATLKSFAAPSGLLTTDIDAIVAFVKDNLANNQVQYNADSGTYSVELDANSVSAQTADFSMGIKAGAASPGTTIAHWDAVYNSLQCIGVRFGIRGADLVTPVNAKSASITRADVTGTPTDPVLTVPGLTTTVDGCLVIGIIGAGAAQTAYHPSGFNDVSGWDKILAGQANADGNTISAGVFSKIQTTAGATGSLAATIKTTGVDFSWVGAMIAIAPASGGGGPSGPTGVLVNFFGI